VTVATASRRPKPLLIVLATLVVVSAVVVGLLTWQTIGDLRTQRDRTDALNAARTGITEVLSYSPANVNAQLASMRKIMSRDFAVQFDRMATAVIVPATQQVGLTTKADVIRSAVVDSQPGQADVLLFVKQVTSSNTQTQAQTVTNQVKVTMTKSNGQWLISNMQPL
jgi:Mce-associated membrane protein